MGMWLKSVLFNLLRNHVDKFNSTLAIQSAKRNDSASEEFLLLRYLHQI
jgi:hypothetical protein